MSQGLSLATATEKSDLVANTIIIYRGCKTPYQNLMKIIYLLILRQSRWFFNGMEAIISVRFNPDNYETEVPVE